MKKFSKFLEETESLEDYINRMIEEAKSFRSTKTKPFPAAFLPSQLGISFEGDEEGRNSTAVLDLAAVAAGTKPAATFQINKPAIKILVNKILQNPRNALLTTRIIEGKPFSIIGKRKNVEEIAKAFKERGKHLSQQELENNHRVIGHNLGFPPDAIEDFLQRMFHAAKCQT